MTVLDTEQDQFVCDGITVVELGGEIDIATAEEAFTRITAAAADGCVVVDLSAVEFIDASGVNTLVRALRFATGARHHLLLACPPRQLTRILDVLALGAVLPTHPDVSAARSAHDGSGHGAPR
ncbi:STAS domain-containing protein [Nocardiopsis dassonvillei]|uniref:STAS domain-containing protein n=1 Tax=Nocardiopsis dassonvillei TaxID=2014 RepID=UPI0008FCD442|nr:STAS domain-containing protein [Nocardiopsis dassonvillei]APC37548.1 anti-anti-sigma factor [Nocardiopsis dassonvillei]